MAPTSTTVAPTRDEHSTVCAPTDDPRWKPLRDKASRRQVRVSTGASAAAFVVSLGAIVASRRLDGKPFTPLLVTVIATVTVVCVAALVVEVRRVRRGSSMPMKSAYLKALEPDEQRTARADIATARPSSDPLLRYAETQYARWVGEAAANTPALLAVNVALIAMYAWAWSGWALLPLLPYGALILANMARCASAWRQRDAARAYLAAVGV